MPGQERVDAISRTADPCGLLDQAWETSRAQPHQSAALASFHRQVRGILDATRLTHAWKTSELPSLSVFQSPHTSRGALPYLGKWRKTFWKRNIAGMLRALVERPQHALFDRDSFIRTWLEHPPLSIPPPLSPSFELPTVRGPVYARQPGYLAWANGEYRRRLQGFIPPFHDALAGKTYDPDDSASCLHHAYILTGASTLAVCEKLGLFRSPPEQIARYLENEGDLNFRFRNQQMLWPPEDKRPYVDLNLAPLYAQVLVYREQDWQAGSVPRSLPLKEGGVSGDERGLTHTQLVRLDIELALWCEVAGRLLNHAASPTEPDPEPSSHEEPSMNAFDRLLPYQVPLAQAMLEAIGRQEDSPPGHTRRFAAPEMAQRHTTATRQPAPQGFTLLPPDLTTPVLEGDRLYCQLDWQRICPNGDWMDIRLFLLPADGGEPEYLDYEIEQADEDDEAPLCLHLRGPAWERLRSLHTPDELNAACGEILFGVANSEMGSGAFVLGVITQPNRMDKKHG